MAIMLSRPERVKKHEVVVTYAPFGIEIDARTLPGSRWKAAANMRHYVASVRWHLDLISRSRTGRALLEAIQNTGKKLTVRPYLGSDENAATGVRAGREPDATADGELLIDGENRPKTAGFWAWKGPITGTGKGCEAVLSYTPWIFGFGGSYDSRTVDETACWGASSVLFHEMCHAYRILRGTRYAGAVIGARSQYDNEEEFFAIVLTNVFVSDPSTQVQRRTLRADHHSHSALAANLSTSAGFLQDAANARLIARLFSKEAGLTDALRAVPADFNPIRAQFGALP